MLKSFRKSGSNPIVFAILGLLIIGLIGFGGQVGSMGGASSAVATVGTTHVTAEEYARTLQSEIRRISQQFGQQLTMDQARAFGIDSQVLAQLVTSAALNNAAGDMGISVGDETVRENLMQTEAFQSPDGKFSKDNYDFALQNLGMTSADYDNNVRLGTARDLIRTGIASGVAMPDIAAATLLAYRGEARRFDWLTLTAPNLPAPVAEPTEAEARAYYDGHGDEFMAPLTREITILALTPADLAGNVTLSDEEVRAEYDSRAAEFNTPETRAIERLAFASDADAAAAKARLDQGAVTFEALAAERQLALTDLDLGIIGASELEPGARDMVFGPTGPGVYGPAPSLLGPALFRVNAILPAVATSFESAEAGLRQELALGQAINLVGEEGVNLDNLLAAGATFDEIAAETQFRQSTLSWHEGLTEGLAADPDFVTAAQDLTEGADPFPVTLADGSIVLMRLDGITEPALRPFEDVKDQAMAAQKAASETAAIAALAETLKAEVAAGKTLPEVATAHGLIVQANQTLTRASNMDNAPPDLKDRLFALDLQGVDLVSGPGRADLVQLTAITPFDAAAEANQAMLAEAGNQLAGQLSGELFNVYAQTIQNQAGVTINDNLLQSLLSQMN